VRMFDKTFHGLCFLALAANTCVGFAGNNTNSSTTTGSVSPSSGDAVKQGDIIFFRSAAPIFTAVYPVSPAPQQTADATAPAASTDATSSGVSGTPSISASKSTKTPDASTPPAAKPAPDADALSDASSKLSDAAKKLSDVADKLGSQAPKQAPTLCAPAGTGFEVQSISAATKNSSPPSAGGGAKTSGAAAKTEGTTPANAQLVYGVFRKHNPLHLLWNNSNTAGGTTPTGNDPCAGHTLITPDVPYEMDASDLDKVSSQRMGFTWGALVIPYKLYLSDRSFKANPSTLLYAGYEGWFPGVSLAFVGSAGLGVTTSSSGSTTSSGSTSSNTTGSTSSASSSSGSSALYTIATGFVATFGGAMKAGVLFGWDYQASGVGFKEEGKTWTAISVGTSF
jgi:hypothetical protein